jgi:hypothetical protein
MESERSMHATAKLKRRINPLKEKHLGDEEMKVKNRFLLLFVVIILSACNKAPSGSIPEDISKKNYKVFVESYELYEERVKEYDGQFVDANGELIEFDEEGIFTDSSILKVAWEDRKRKENGEKGVLTEKEVQLKDDFMSLYFIKQIDYFTKELKQMAIDKNPEYADPVQAAINLEKKIINTLELEKKPVTAKLKKEPKKLNKDDSNGVAKEEKQDIYQGEPKKETGEQAQKTADKVQEYVVNIVNDLTIVENMSSDIQSSYSYSQVYGSGYTDGGENGPKGYGPDYNKKIDDSIEIIKKALNDLNEQKAPKNTEYFVLEPALKQFVNRYQKIIDDIEISKSNSNGSNAMRDLMRELQIIDHEIQEIESSFAASIIANNYLEYDALLSVWKQGKNYQFNDNTHGKIPSAIKREFFRNKVDFEQDLARY